MKALPLIIFSFVTSLFAHDDHDNHLWSTDKAAFEYTKTALKIKKSKTQALKSTLIEVDGSYFAQKLKEFSGATSVKIDGKNVKISERGSKQGMAKALAYLANEYKSFGYNVRFEDFGNFFSRGNNFIAEKKGEDSSGVIIISAHIDSVGNAGANDNGTGSIGSLAIAKALAPYRFKYDLRFIGFDKEEKGLVGSKAYVKNLTPDEKNKIKAVINFEMMGTNSRQDGHFHVIDCDRNESVFITRVLEGISNYHQLGLVNVPACTTRSDHASFWESKIPAIVISENFFGGDSDKCYHKRCDKFDDRLDFSYMQKISTAVASTAFELLQVLK